VIVNKPKLHSLAVEAIAKLRNDGVTVDDGAVLWIDDAAKRMASARRRVRPAGEIVDWPVYVGGVALRPLTFAAMEWLDRMPEELRDRDDVLAFACCHGYAPEVLMALTSAREVRYAVRAWLSEVTCSPSALYDTVDEITARAPVAEIADAVAKRDGALKSDPVTYGTLVRALVRRYPGSDPAYWMWSVSADRAIEALADSGVHADSEPRVTAEEIDAHAAFLSVVKAVREGSANG
jgi:hypothetical protein